MNNSDRNKYLEIAQSGITPEAFFKRLQDDGLTKFDCFVLLRDGLNLSLAERDEVSNKVEVLTDEC